MLPGSPSTAHKTIRFFHVSFHADGMTYRAQSWGFPVCFQKALEDPALQRANPVLASSLYFPALLELKLE